MLTQEENEMLTRTGPGTPAGDLLRRYWQPAGLSEELPEGGAPVPVRLLGEDLVLFRDEQGRPGLLGLHCAHRGADLSYGRLEDGGLRCIYHGWLYDIHGHCLEQPGEPLGAAAIKRANQPTGEAPSPALGPAEPAGSTFHERIRLTAYPCQERAGVILAYLGPGEAPLIPAYEFFNAPDDRCTASKVFQECNHLQGNEGNIDPIHLSFLHRLDVSGDLNQRFNTEVTSAHIETEETDFGLRVYAVRSLGEKNYVRVTNLVLPNFSAVAGDPDGYSVNWHVPIDDTHHWRFGIRFNRETPLDRSRWGQREMDDAYHLTRSKANRYLQDRESMKTWSFIGLGKNFVLHDTCATEGAGPIQDRTQEHLGSTDRAIVAARLLLLGAIRQVQDGRDPPHVIRDPELNAPPEIFARNDVVLPANIDWHGFWRDESSRALAVSTRSTGVGQR